MERIAFYSPGMVGLGHIRRTLLIAQVLTSDPVRAAALVIGEARQAGSFAIPAGVDILTLPALRKANGQATPRYLDVSLQKLVAMRSQAILGMVTAFEPDVLVVDHLPRGAERELEPTLDLLRRRGRTRLVLGLRDVLEAPEIVSREWAAAQSEEAIRTYYDTIWVYGDRAVYDQAHEYRLPSDIAGRMHYAGYLDPVQRTGAAHDADPIEALGLPPGRLALCMVGGGQDGEALALTFALASANDMNRVVITGPFMPPAARARLHAIAAGSPRLRVLEFVEEPTRLLRRADRLVTMGGYNSVCESLSYETHTLVTPRALPRREQRIRAERLRALGLVEMLPEEELSPERIDAWLARDLGAPPRVRDRIDLGALTRLPHLLAGLSAQQRRPALSRSHTAGGWPLAAH